MLNFKIFNADGINFSGYIYYGDEYNSETLEIIIEDRVIWEITANRISESLNKKVAFNIVFAPFTLENIKLDQIFYLRIKRTGDIIETESSLILKGTANNNKKLFKLLDEGYTIEKFGTLMKPLALQDNNAFFDAYTYANDKFQELFGSNLYLAYGTLLGCVRNNDFIAHDHDYDLAYFSNKTNMQDVLQELVEIVSSLNLSGENVKIIAGGQVHWYIKTKTGKDIYLDIFTSWFERDVFNLFFAVSEKMDLDKLLPLKKYKFLNNDVFVPRDEKSVLAMIYGESWINPDPNFNWGSRSQAAVFMSEQLKSIYTDTYIERKI